MQIRENRCDVVEPKFLCDYPSRNEENSNFAEDWNLIGGLGDDVPQKQKLFSY